MSTYQEGNIECPYYSSQDSHSIRCEGYIKEVRVVKQSFTSPERKKKYIDKYCTVDGGKGCMHHRIMSHLYDKGVLK